MRAACNSNHNTWMVQANKNLLKIPHQITGLTVLVCLLEIDAMRKRCDRVRDVQIIMRPSIQMQLCVPTTNNRTFTNIWYDVSLSSIDVPLAVAHHVWQRVLLSPPIGLSVHCEITAYFWLKWKKLFSGDLCLAVGRFRKFRMKLRLLWICEATCSGNGTDRASFIFVWFGTRTRDTESAYCFRKDKYWLQCQVRANMNATKHTFSA